MILSKATIFEQARIVLTAPKVERSDLKERNEQDKNGLIPLNERFEIKGLILESKVTTGLLTATVLNQAVGDEGLYMPLNAL